MAEAEAATAAPTAVVTAPPAPVAAEAAPEAGMGALLASLNTMVRQSGEGLALRQQVEQASAEAEFLRGQLVTLLVDSAVHPA